MYSTGPAIQRSVSPCFYKHFWPHPIVTRVK